MGTLDADIEAALARGAAAAARAQRPDGSWASENDAGPLFTGAALAFESALGVLRPADAATGERSLRAVQRADGSAEAWPAAGHGSREATSFWLAGMRAIGVPDGDPAVQRARAFVAASGGLGANRLIVRALLAAVGLIPPASLPRLPLAQRLLPGHDALLARVLGVNALVPAHTLAPLIRGLQDRGARGPLRRALDARVVDYLTEHQDPSGSFAGVPYYTHQAALTLRVCGVPAEDPRVQRAVAFARGVYVDRPEGLFVGAFFSTHWDTAHMLRVLGPDAPTGPAVRRGVAYLIAGQARAPAPADWQTPPPGAPATGGWAWQPGNARNPDLDSTAEVLSALIPIAAATQDPALTAAVQDGLSWMRPFQNRDGGWAAFSHGKRSPPPGVLFARVPPARPGPRGPAALRDRAARRLAELGDPSSADVTGRVLLALGAAGHRRGEPEIDAAIAFLARHQLPSGAWWARWSVAYLTGTAYVCTGLLAVGEPPDGPLLRPALAWLLARQNPDGGWGEGPAAFVDPAAAGCGPSGVQVTGVVLWALLRAGQRGPATDRGLRFLLDRQAADGSWADPQPYGVVFPHLHYYHSSAFPLYFAMEALHAARS